MISFSHSQQFMTLEVDLIHIHDQTLNPLQLKMLILSPVKKNTARASVPTVLVGGSENAQAKVLEVRCVTADNKTSTEGFYKARHPTEETASFGPVVPE